MKPVQTHESQSEPAAVAVLLGKDLRVGDVIEVWWSAGGDMIASLAPYGGRLRCLAGARIAELAVSGFGMTLIADEDYYLISRGSLPKQETKERATARPLRRPRRFDVATPASGKDVVSPYGDA
jgi:hypothetical protein